MKFKIVLVVFCLCNCAFAKVSAYGAKIYDVHKKSEHVFTLEVKREVLPDGKMVNTSGIFRYPNGEIAVEENGQMNGSDLIWVRTFQRQLKEQGEIKIEGKTIHFTFKKENEPEQKASEELTEKTIVPASLEPYILESWNGLLNGESIEFKIAVWDRLETVRFSLKKTEEWVSNGQNFIKFRLKPRNFIISALLSSIYFTWDKDKKRIVEAESRVTPYLKVQEEFKPLDAIVKYFYPEN